LEESRISNRDEAMQQIPFVQNGELVRLLRREDILKWLQVKPEMMVKTEVRKIGGYR
jgi:hypothetical protein